MSTDCDPIQVKENVPYVKNGSPRQVCDLYLAPNTDSYVDHKASTVIIYVHGGGWSAGEKARFKLCKS